MVLYHRTTAARARRILAEGFRDGSGRYGTDCVHRGVWFADVPLDENEGATGEVVLAVTFPAGESAVAAYEWIEEGKGYREWLVPADLVNRSGTVCVVTDPG